MKPNVVSGILVFVVGISMGWQRVHAPVEARRSQLTVQLASEREAQAVREQVAKLLGEIDQFRKRLAPEPETAWLVGEVGKLAKDAKIELASIAPQQQKLIQEFTHLSVIVQFSSSYHDLGKFLSVLESSRSFIRVDELSMTPDRSTSKQGQGVQLVKLTLSALHAPPFSASAVKVADPGAMQ
jgi:type IV pilus assembly protein PilO